MWFYLILSRARRVAAKRSYPTSEVRGSGGECQAATAQEWPSGATPCPRLGGRLGGVTPHLRSGGVAGRTNPASKDSGCTGAGGPRGAIQR